MEHRSSKGQAKLVDVARLARVSTATVSRALSSPHLVNADTLHRVEAAIRKLQYVPHGAARALRSQRTRTVGAIVPTLGNAIFANFIQALQKSLESKGYRLLLSCNEYDARVEEGLVEPLIQHGVDGIVLIGRDHSERLFRMMTNHGIPYVLTWTVGDSSQHPCIGFDNAEAAERIVNFLVDLRHQQFAIIAGICKGNDRARERVAGTIRALAARRITLDPGRVLERPYTLTAGREAMHALMKLKPRPTAVICGNDVLAVGALAECHAMGIDVPRVVSIVGFDDMDMASITVPPLTTVRVPTEELGRLTADYIVSRIEGVENIPLAPLEVDIVARGTTAPPRKGA